MRVGAIWRGLVLIVAAGLLAACTPSSGVSPSPTPTISAPPVSPSPTENAIERQERLDYAAAEKAYRAFRAEYGRVLEAGGATEATKVMKETASGSYLAEHVSAVRAYKRLSYHQMGVEETVYIRRSAHFEDRVTLDVCEDSRAAKTVNRAGKYIGAGELRTAELTVTRKGAAWTVSAGRGEKVDSCD